MNTRLKTACIIVLALGLGPAGLSLAKGSKDAAPATPTVLETTPRERQVARLVTRFVEKAHYSHLTVDDALSEAALKTYLETLDGNRHYFLQSDIAYFDRYRTNLDDVLRTGEIEPVFDIFRLYRLRAQQSLNYAISTLDKEPDFTVDESYEFDREKRPWAQTPAELQDLWRKRVKNDAISLMLADKTWPETAEILRKRYTRVLDRINTLDSDDVFETFMNAFARTLDPHSSYLSPRQSEEYKIQMSLSYQGIGASLQLEEDVVQVINVIPGGPAAIDGRIKPNDRITGVGQGDAGEMVDVVGWQLDDVVQLIRGEAGTKVRLQVQPGDAAAGGAEQVITLVRNKVKLEEQAAKKEILTIERNGEPVKIGVINVPSFYQDFDARNRGEKDYVSTTRDVRRLIGELKREGVTGLVLDLRGNGGGHLSEATGLTGLFIESGPVVQLRNNNGQIEVLDDPVPAVAWSGPLVVLVDRFSASASEIFAAAIQDYRRGIVIGQQTFGKGTVQNLYVLDQYAPRASADRGLGQLTLTIGKFYRVNGGSTQHRGVIPDIELPSAIDSSLIGESSRDRALPWDQIAATRYAAQQPLDAAIDALTRFKTAQLIDEPDFRYLRAELEAANDLRSRTSVSVNLKARRDERESLRQAQLDRENARRAARGLPKVDSLDSLKPEDQPDVLKDTAATLAWQLARVARSTNGTMLTRASGAEDAPD
ncbi:MAG: carboxy terminal-processing peptidase [Chromatiales bacterium]|jgi:carboxyl-terminal processing protease|nr:carboxy terminal-processing peptidase [Chromatiales bacterium]